MDVREKLVELIAQKVCDTWSESCDQWLPHDCGKCYANDCHISELADHLIANGVAVQEWISVKDRLPDYFTSVLVWCPGNKCIYAAYRNTRQEWYTFDDTIAGHVVVNMVTHWMPMPAPPKGE